MTEAILVAFLIGTIAAGMPLMLAALGETIGEQSGVLNLGIEGIMLIGGYFGFVAVLMTQSFWLGLLVGTLAGVASSLIMLVLSVWLGLNQIVVGIAITLAGSGITSVLHTQNYGSTNPRLGLDTPWKIPFLSDIPVVGPSIFSQPGMFTVALLIAAAVAWWLHKTNPGLRLRAAGQKPASLDAAGGSVLRTRSLAVLAGGAFSGLGGAYLALLSTGAFTPFMTHGLGYIAIVVTMLARGRISWVVVASLVYGASVAVGTAIQLTNINLPNDVIKMLPFIIVMITLIVFARSAYIPPALAVPYTRGAR
ncbi:ABC transporter permease [Ruicaihuangia caeni]|uniref:ABC transporter permease n=1 Tax=Ruicaihuangia caeni TaxID=3042517 RepID=A0AAW6TC36_9MICO|nr:ABC transporter permease [Klugiella sp. YN-L-19]MDI2098612.1 ABC transporter permease [Klugiella sp. YN-L-19]